ncbi:hypothetical protein BJAS_P3470 [Bathymodiolus japonicus methanotrophic gill symbiont]|nr:hypothetical protein [Bathymodiolus japonicus methanotrophic gill symbiont]GFO72933.1 hypothetical protein BJAS_P3470 [Bathymodiolus japonicus methanotrophic gill symbiont]
MTKGLFKSVDNFVAKGVLTKKSYVDGKSSVWKDTTTTNGNKLLTSGELGFDSDSGQLVAKFAPYFDKADAQVIQISYDKRWIKTQEVRGDRINQFLHSFSKDVATVTHKANDPTGKSKDVVVRNTQSHDFVKRTKTNAQADGTSTVGTYDMVGNLVNEVDYRGLVSTKAYDSNRKFIENVTPDSGKENYTYSATGKLIKHTRGGISNDYTYDAHDRIINRVRTDVGQHSVIDYTWDTAVKGSFNQGMLTSMTDGVVKVDMNYNKDGHLSDKVWSSSGKNLQSYAYTYYDGGYPLSVTYPDKSLVNYSYNKTGELSNFQYKASTDKSFPEKSTVSFSNYGINSKPLLISYGKKLAMTKTIDGWGRTLVDSSASGSKTVSVVKYSWDKAGNIVSKSNNGDDTTYTYDALNRLVTADNARRKLVYKYDANNNLLQNGANTFVMEAKTNRLATGVIAGKPITFQV